MVMEAKALTDIPYDSQSDRIETKHANEPGTREKLEQMRAKDTLSKT